MCPYVSWPIIVEQSEVDAFGPIYLDEAKRLLEPGFCILRRSPMIGSPYEWYLTVALVNPGEFTNYRITSVNGALMFAVAVRNLMSLILIHYFTFIKIQNCSLTLRRPLRRKVRMRWFFDISKVKESSFLNRTSLTPKS